MHRANDLKRCFFKEDTQLAIKHRKRYSTLLAIREMKIKTTGATYYFIPTRMARIRKTVTSVGENGEKLEPLCVAGGDKERYNCFGKQSDSS